MPAPRTLPHTGPAPTVTPARPRVGGNKWRAEEGRHVLKLDAAGEFELDVGALPAPPVVAPSSGETVTVSLGNGIVLTAQKGDTIVRHDDGRFEILPGGK